MSRHREERSSANALTIEKSCQFEHIYIHMLDQIKITSFTRFITRYNQAFKPTKTYGAVDNSISIEKAKLCSMQLVLVSSRIVPPDGGNVHLYTHAEKKFNVLLKIKIRSDRLFSRVTKPLRAPLTA